MTDALLDLLIKDNIYYFSYYTFDQLNTVDAWAISVMHNMLDNVIDFLEW